MIPPRCPGPVDRREFLQIGALALGGLSTAEVLAARARAGQQSPDTSVILVYLNGGPSQLETYDLKPDAPSETRSQFRPIPTIVPGMDLCEHFPRQAKIADKFSLVRSLHHDVGIHSDGGITVLTGKRPVKLDPTSQSKSQHPDYGMVASRGLGLHRDFLPRYVSIPQKHGMTRPTYLGVAHNPLVVGDPSSPSYRPPVLKTATGSAGRKLEQRRALLGQLDRLRGDLDQDGSMSGIDEFRRVAMRMLTSDKMVRAFDIAREPDALRDRYGRHLWGQSCLLARRLAEAGTSAISIIFNTPKTGQEFTNWDDHAGATPGRPGHFAKYMKVRLPYMDEALSALIEDHFRPRAR